MAKGDQKNTDGNPTDETPGINPGLSCSAPSLVSEPPLVPELQTGEFSSESVASQVSITTNPEHIGAKFCPEPLFSSIVVQRYDGEMHGDLFHGEGIAYFLGGNTYKGMFAEGYMHGRGVYTWEDGVIYEGDFDLNVPTGYGKYTWLDGSWYEGEVQNGLRHGVGTYRCGTKCVSYRGQWHHGNRHGKGKIFYNQEMTSWYEGDWVNNTIDGWGVRRYLSGNVYEGQWKKSRRHGEGMMKWLTLGQQYSGHWENGMQHGQGTHTWFQRRIAGSQYPQRNEYTGQFVQGARQGQGTFFYANGASYEGGWQANKKHGQGKFTSKDGRVSEGEFVDDRMSEYPALPKDAVLTPDLNILRISTSVSVESDSPRDTSGPGSGSSLLSQDMTLDIQSLLVQFPEPQRDAELKQMELAMLRHVAELRSTYCFYSRLGHDSPDNTFLLSRLQFWRLLKDCKVHQEGITLAQMDRIVGSDDAPKDIHSPFGTLLLRNFLSHLVILANHIYHREMTSSGNVLVTCFSKLMEDNILPNATNVKGILFSYPHHAAVASYYLMKCWAIYQYFCKQYSLAPRNLTISMRQFIWILKDLNVYDNKLTIGKVVEILFTESLPLEDVSHRNLDLEMTFLEFFEALLGCAEVKHPYTVEISPKYLLEISRQGGTGATPASKELGIGPAHLLQGPSSLPGKSGDVFHHLSTFKEKNGKRGELLLRSHKAGTGSVFTQRAAEVEGGPALPNPDTDSAVWLEGEPAATLTCSMPALETRSSTAPSSRAEPSGEAGTEPESEQTLWACRIHLFFKNTFFPAYERRLLLDREAEDERVKKGQVQSTSASTAEASRSLYSP
ncbi:radial spoke head 10 homolog B [Brienomyrus brachyistius]|uniref:radial spoke head 10 homolog B n=1 Tax=Brienomyrus brachyistius TaxID=42636 RepID=UPI0020B33A03|nr:radial spoke head 10 homolog B [Brienomyrus brachyistius]